MAKVGYLEVRVGSESHRIIVTVDDDTASESVVEIYVGANTLRVPSTSLSGVVDVEDVLAF